MIAEAATMQHRGSPSVVRELAGELLPEAPRLANAMNEHLFAMMPELRERDDGELPEETRTSCEANIAQVLRLLSLGAAPDALVVPPEAAQWARSLVRRGITLAALLRAYRLGHAWLYGIAGRRRSTTASLTPKSSWPPRSAARRSCSTTST
jgi:hypothetical protein